MLWLVGNSQSLPTALIPDVTKVFQTWLISRQSPEWSTVNAVIVGLLFEWLERVEEEMAPRIWRDAGGVPPSLNIPHLRDVRDEIRMTAFAFATLNADAAACYLRGLDPETIRHHEMVALLQAPAALAKAAPAALADLALGMIIEKEDPDALFRHRHDELGPFGVHDYQLLPASPGQGPFFEILETAPAEGLRLVRTLVGHATQWRRDSYRRAQQPFPRISVPFPSGIKSFEGDWSVYYWARNLAPSAITASALMALEAWGHRQIESGRPFVEVLHDVLGPDGSSIAFVSVAVDLVLSHWPEARDEAWPLVATPELLHFDDARLTHDIVGVQRLLETEREASTWRVKRADLDEKLSRRSRLSDNIGHYVFHGEPGQLEAFRAALEQARNEIRQKSRESEDPVNGLRATAERAVRMTYPENWPIAKVTLADGSEAEVRQYQRDPQELRLIEAETRRIERNNRHQAIRASIQFALFDPAKSTPEIVAEGIAWAKEHVSPVDSSSVGGDEDHDNFSREWDQRASVMAAALAARDYVAADRTDVLAWALPVLHAAAVGSGKEYLGNPQIEYNMAAIAALGLIAIYLADQDRETRDALLGLASHHHLAVVNALGSHLPELSRVDARLPRAVLRVAMATAIHPRRADSETKRRDNDEAYRNRVEAAIATEKQWFGGFGVEPAWPALPRWPSRQRRSIRLSGIPGDTAGDNESGSIAPDEYADEHALGALVSHITRLTVDDMPRWVFELAAHLMAWTIEANGPHGENDGERSNRPYTWNSRFFEFVGILSVALPHAEVVSTFLLPLTRCKDEVFHDGMAEFLRGFDRAMQASDARKPEDPVAVRVLLAERIRSSRNYGRLGREKGFTSEIHAGDALNAMFFQPPRFANHGRPSIPENWKGLDAVMPTLAELVTRAPSSGYLATLFLNLIEPSPRALLLPFVVQAATAWCSSYSADTNFWSEKDVGGRLCSWLGRTFTGDPASVDVLPTVADQLLVCLDILIQLGIAQASEIEEWIARNARGRQSA